MTAGNIRFSAILAEGSSIGFVSLFITRYRQKNKYQLKQLICTLINHAASVPAESISNTSTAESRHVACNAISNFKIVTRHKIRLLIPLVIIGGLILYSWTILLVEGYIPIWRHYVALGLFGLLIFLFTKDFTKAVVATGLYLLLGTCNLLSLTASTVWNSYGVKVGSTEIWTPSFQFLSFCLFILFAILNFDKLTDIYYGYKKAQQRKTKEIIEVDDEGVTVVGDKFRTRINWFEIIELNVYKKDFTTFDRVELDIVYGDKTLTINEDVKGWTEFVGKTKQIFPTVPESWEAEVVHQPYVTNFTTIYQRV